MIHPGGGRNDIPHRLKRHFCIFNCALPSDSSMDKIFSVIAEGYFCVSRFDFDIVDIVPRFVPLTRVLWQRVKAKMLPTPAKFHYIFNLRDLSRIWEGILKVRNQECPDLRSLISLWKHECTRVIADRLLYNERLSLGHGRSVEMHYSYARYETFRFVSQEDRDWFEKTILQTVYEEAGEEWEALVPEEPHWVNFMKDPDDLMEAGMGDDIEIADYPNIYEEVKR